MDSGVRTQLYQWQTPSGHQFYVSQQAMLYLQVDEQIERGYLYINDLDSAYKKLPIPIQNARDVIVEWFDRSLDLDKKIGDETKISSIFFCWRTRSEHTFYAPLHTLRIAYKEPNGEFNIYGADGRMLLTDAQARKLVAAWETSETRVDPDAYTSINWKLKSSSEQIYVPITSIMYFYMNSDHSGRILLCNKNTILPITAEQAENFATALSQHSIDLGEAELNVQKAGQNSHSIS